MPANVVDFVVPKRPRVVEKQAMPDQRKYAVVPFGALSDKRLHHLSIRVLALICSYANRAGITWVGQTRIGTHLGISKQAVSKAVTQLKKAGYLQVVSKGFRGERTDTIRVVFDAGLTTQDAIAITSGQEDTRPPEQQKREEELRNIMADNDLPDLSPEQIAANIKRLKVLLGTLASPTNFRQHQPQSMETLMARTKPIVKRKATPKVNLAVDQKLTMDNPQVDYVDKKAVNPEVDYGPDIVNLQVDQNTKNIGLIEVYKVYEMNKKNVVITESDMKWSALVVEVGVSASDLVAAIQSTNSLAEACKQVLDAKGL
jgi:predicted transcriptional regulator